jgi:uncharacterized protein (TIGR00369 family)
MTMTTPPAGPRGNTYHRPAPSGTVRHVDEHADEHVDEATDEWIGPPGDGPHVWRTLGFRRRRGVPGQSSVEWEASADYAFPTSTGPVVQGGLVTAVLDSAMGGACWTVLEPQETFLTADLRVEFLRTTRPGKLVAHGTVVRRTRRVVFCAAELLDADGVVLAAGRCTQVILPKDGPAGRGSPV